MSGLEAKPDGRSEEVAELVRSEPMLEAQGGEFAIVEAPESIEGAQWLFADESGDYFRIWREDVWAQVELLKAFARRVNALKVTPSSSCAPEDGDHDCWGSMQQLDMKTVGSLRSGEYVESLFCEQCGQRYWRRLFPDTMTDSENREWIFEADE